VSYIVLILLLNISFLVSEWLRKSLVVSSCE
jgi:hypothetical protein